jgi:hypothetical protein
MIDERWIGEYLEGYIVAQLTYLPGIYLEGPRKPRKTPVRIGSVSEPSTSGAASPAIGGAEGDYACEIEWEEDKQTTGPWSASELYRPSNRRLSAELVPTLADRGCRVVTATNPHGR